MNASETQGKRLLMRMLSLLALAFILTAAGAWFATRYYSEQPAAHHASQTFFSQRFETADNSPLELSSLRGKVIVVNFWATWCPPCVEEMPELDALQRELEASSPNRVKMIGIGIDSPSNIRQFAAKSPVAYPLLLGGTTGNELARLFGNDKGLLPYTVIIGQDGNMLKTIVGKVRIDALRTQVRAAL
jgi:thiol-disulfide isomerase/thioredoxin